MFRPGDKDDFELIKLIDKIHGKGIRTRLSCVLLKGYIDSVEAVQELIDFARARGVFQLTLRKADIPKNPRDLEVARFIEERAVTGKDASYQEIVSYFEKEGALCDILPHGASVYEVKGQNVCITTGLTVDAGEKAIRQLIFFPPDLVTTSWENIHGGRVL